MGMRRVICLGAPKSEGGDVFRRSLLAVAATLALAGAAAANDADLCGEDRTDPSLRAEACTRLIRTGKYRGNNLAAVHNNRGIALAQSGRWQEAATEWQRALQLNPNHVNARRNLDRLRALAR